MGFIEDYAINHKLTPFISMQNHYSLVYREEEREMFPTLKVCISSQCGVTQGTRRTISYAALWSWIDPMVSACTWSPDKTE